MLGIGAIEIEEATYCLGMCGHIVVRINGSGKRYRINMSTLDGWQVSDCECGDEWSKPKQMESEEFIALLPPARGWDRNVFIAVWAGYAAGYKQGLDKGRRYPYPHRKPLAR